MSEDVKPSREALTRREESFPPLLPLPEPDNDVAVDGEGNEAFFEFFTDEQMEAYARANLAAQAGRMEELTDLYQVERRRAEHAVMEASRHKAENERLRAEAAKRDGIDPWAVLLRAQEAEARAERLREEMEKWRSDATDLANNSGDIVAKERARAERLAEALRRVEDLLVDVECGGCIDAGSVDQCHDTIRAALDQEGGE